MNSPTTFAVTIDEADNGDCHVDIKMITKGDINLEEAIAIFAAAATEPDETQVTFENGLTVKLGLPTPGEN